MREILIGFEGMSACEGGSITRKVWHSDGMIASWIRLIEEHCALISNLQIARTDAIPVLISKAKGDGFSSCSGIVAATLGHMCSFSLASIRACGRMWVTLAVPLCKKGS